MPERRVDPSVPNAARMYDHWLGGDQNFEADRAAATRIAEMQPLVVPSVRANRAFLGRVVRFLVENGIRQIIDVGAGLPTQDNVHDVAHQVSPNVRVVYCDIDPVCVSHAQALLASDNTVAIEADLRNPAQILDNPEVLDLIDFTQPLAVLMIAVLHFVADSANPAGLIARYRDAMPPGSYLAISHGSYDGFEANEVRNREIRSLYRKTPTPLAMRSRGEILEFFDGFRLVDPGLVWIPDWRPDGPIEMFVTDASGIWGGVGRKG